MSPADLPDETEAYVAGVGVVSLGELRASRGAIGGTDDADRRFWEKLATQNLTFRICPDGALRRGRKA